MTNKLNNRIFILLKVLAIKSNRCSKLHANIENCTVVVVQLIGGSDLLQNASLFICAKKVDINFVLLIILLIILLSFKTLTEMSAR